MQNFAKFACAKNTRKAQVAHRREEGKGRGNNKKGRGEKGKTEERGEGWRTKELVE